MQIPEELLKEWESLKSYGDNKDMIRDAEFRITQQAICLAFKNKKCNDVVFGVIRSFYEKKKAKLFPHV